MLVVVGVGVVGGWLLVVVAVGVLGVAGDVRVGDVVGGWCCWCWCWCCWCGVVWLASMLVMWLEVSLCVGVGVVGRWHLVVVAVGVLGMRVLVMWLVLLMLAHVPICLCQTKTLCPSG